MQPEFIELLNEAEQLWWKLIIVFFFTCSIPAAFLWVICEPNKKAKKPCVICGLESVQHFPDTAYTKNRSFCAQHKVKTIV